MNNIFQKYTVISSNKLKKKPKSDAQPNKQKDYDYNIIWHDFEHEISDKLWDLHIKDPTASQCREFILSYLGTEIEFKLDEETIHPEPEFEKILKTEWSKFIRDVFDSVFIMGICPIKFVKSLSSMNEDYYPVVLKKGSYKIQVAFLIETETILFRILRPINYFFNAEKSTTFSDLQSRRGQYDPKQKEGLAFTFMDNFDIFQSGFNFRKSGFSFFTGDGETNRGIRQGYKKNLPAGWVLDRNSVVLHGFGYDPEINGQLTSRLRSILEYQEFTVTQGRMMLLNQARLLSRPLYIKNNEAGDNSHKDGNQELNSTIHRQEMKKRRELETQKKEMAMLSASFHNDTVGYLLSTPQGPAKKVMADSQPWGGTLSQVLISDPGPPVSIVDLPKGYDLPSGQKPDITLGMRFFDCEDKLDEKTCAAYGVLIDLIKNRGIHKNSATQSEFFQKTLLRWMVILQEILTFCYSAIYGKQDREDLIATQLEMRRMHRDLLKKIDDFVVEEWTDNDGPMTKLENVGKKSRKKIDLDAKSDSEDDSDSSEKEEKKDKKKSKKKSDDVSIFDPSIQLDVGTMQDDSKNQYDADDHIVPFKKTKTNVGNVRVSLSFNSALMIDLFAFVHTSGALLDKEYWSALRHYIGYPVDDKTLSQLSKQMKEKIKEGMVENKPGASSSGSKKPETMKDPTKAIEKLSKKLDDSVFENTGSSGDGKGRSKDVEKEKKKKRQTSMKKASESNTKRKISARKHQALNAEQGKKNKEKSV